MAVTLHREDRYSFLAGDLWRKICSLLIEDSSQHNLGMEAFPPDDPEYGGEPEIGLYLEVDGMNWYGEEVETLPLSEVLLYKNIDDADEMLRLISGLKNTVRHLEGALAARHPTEPVKKAIIESLRPPL